MIFLVSARPRSSCAECAAPCLAAVLLRPRAAGCADGGPPGPADPWDLPCSEGRSGGGGTRLGPGRDVAALRGQGSLGRTGGRDAWGMGWEGIGGPRGGFG